MIRFTVSGASCWTQWETPGRRRRVKSRTRSSPAINRAGRVADGWFANPRVPPGPESEKHFEFFRGGAREAGRDPDKLGIDATVLAGDRGSQAWAAEAEQWQAMGATHLTFRTMAAGMTSNDQHIEAIRKFREVWPAK